jgi:ankyrin repeat protein
MLTSIHQDPKIMSKVTHHLIPSQCHPYHSDHDYQDLEYPDSPTSILSYDPRSPPPSPSPPPHTDHPHHKGTIYESLLAPLSPSTTLPIPTNIFPSNSSDSKLQSQLNILISKEDPEELDMFLTKNLEQVDINHYSQKGDTALQRVCQDSGSSSLKIAKVLVKHGADPKLTNKDGWSPVHVASTAGDSRLLLFLLRSLRS